MFITDCTAELHRLFLQVFCHGLTRPRGGDRRRALRESTKCRGRFLILLLIPDCFERESVKRYAFRQWMYMSRRKHGRNKMMPMWSNWERFPDAYWRNDVEIPTAPGIYEVRHTVTGRVVAFGWTSNLARALSTRERKRGFRSRLASVFRTARSRRRVTDLEYRTCVAGSKAEAKTAARRLLGLRQNFWRQRWALGFGAGMKP